MATMKKILKRLIYGYVVFVFLAFHAAAFAYGYSWLSSLSKPLNVMALDFSYKLDNRFSGAGGAMRAALFSTGLLQDPTPFLRENLSFDLPRWRGTGANALRRDTAPRYGLRGDPIALDDDNRFGLTPRAVTTKTVKVGSAAELAQALAQARAGQEIVLAPGVYHLAPGTKLDTAAGGDAKSPIVLRGETVSGTVLEFGADAQIRINHSHWVMSDLILRGACVVGKPPCGVPLVVSAGASALTLRNLFASGFDLLVQGQPGDRNSLIDGSTLVGGALTDSPAWRQALNKEISKAETGQKLVVVCPEKGPPPTCGQTNLYRALQAVGAGGVVLLQTGVYNQAVAITEADVTLIAEPGAHLQGKFTDGKGALVLKANRAVIDGLECSQIRVGSGNGACVRQDRGDFILRGVHFHHNQMAVLTGQLGGTVLIEDSYFHHSGNFKWGALGHNVYVNSGDFTFRRSWTIRAGLEGHELKSRAKVTRIEDSLLATVDAVDSRTIDLPNAGELIIENSVIHEGPRSANWDVIGYGLEVKGESKYEVNRVTMRNNTIVSDAFNAVNVLNARNTDDVTFADNVVVGKVKDQRRGNTYYDDRAAAGLPAYPQLVPLHGVGTGQ
ncbi:MAG: right-handed parallel beta-helix repeat-containing protein [Rhodobacterales bacterium]|nr:right-handed parallel beta-helix repeat-containing protein [Rhodobacterales bacterium]